MNTYIIIAVVLMGLLSAFGEKDACGQNEIWSDCPTACEPTCKNIPELLKPCNNECLKPACICKEGFVRSDKNECVTKNNCCKANMIWSNCPSTCPSTCINFWKPQECIRACNKPGCKCKVNHVLNDKEECVYYKNCCEGNKTFSLCPSKCPRTCKNYKELPSCPMECDEPSCVCKAEFVLNSNDECVPKSDC